MKQTKRNTNGGYKQKKAETGKATSNPRRKFNLRDYHGKKVKR